MGQSASHSADMAVVDLEMLKDKIQRQASIARDVITLSYADFRKKVDELNELALMFGESENYKLSFVVKKGSDSTILWKKTVRIACLRINKAAKKIESHKILTLTQFLHAYNMLVNYASVNCNAVQSSSSHDTFEVLQEGSDSLSKDKQGESMNTTNPLTTSVILEKISSVEGDACIGEECCICMERKTEMMLPCTHSYCLVCLEQWNVSNKTCPLCREELEGDESWVISEAPDLEEVTAELQKAMAGLTGSDPKHS